MFTSALLSTIDMLLLLKTTLNIVFESLWILFFKVETPLCQLIFVYWIRSDTYG